MGCGHRSRRAPDNQPGGAAACAKIRLSQMPTAECIDEITSNPDVLYVEHVAL
jgi:hypothetical protein